MTFRLKVFTHPHRYQLIYMPSRYSCCQPCKRINRTRHFLTFLTYSRTRIRNQPVRCSVKKPMFRNNYRGQLWTNKNNYTLLFCLCPKYGHWRHKIFHKWHQKLIVAKYNGFATSERNGILDFDSFLLRLNNKIDILRTIAFRSNRLSQFKKTWEKLL